MFIGPPGVGKTGLASGLLLRAIESGYRGRFLRAQDLDSCSVGKRAQLRSVRVLIF